MLATPMAVAQEGGVAPLAAVDPNEARPLAAVRGAREERCELITAKRGEGAQVEEEKKLEKGREFPFLESQGVLLDEFRVDEDERRACAAAFGLLAGGPGTAVTLGAAGIGAATVAAAAAAAVAVGAAAAAAAAGGGGGTIPATSTVSDPGPPQ